MYLLLEDTQGRFCVLRSLLLGLPSLEWRERVLRYPLTIQIQQPDPPSGDVPSMGPHHGIRGPTLQLLLLALLSPELSQQHIWEPSRIASLILNTGISLVHTLMPRFNIVKMQICIYPRYSPILCAYYRYPLFQFFPHYVFNMRTDRVAHSVYLTQDGRHSSNHATAHARKGAAVTTYQNRPWRHTGWRTCAVRISERRPAIPHDESGTQRYMPGSFLLADPRILSSHQATTQVKELTTITFN